MNNRTARERKAYDEGNVFEENTQWHKRFIHVFECPNTIRHERLFENLTRTQASGKRVLDIGCGKGETSRRIYDFGAQYVHGVDISESFIMEAKKTEINGRLEFSLQDLMEPLPGIYDVIVGRAILHHLDYRIVLNNLYKNNLADNGAMIFMEPLGANMLIRLYQMISRSAHTPDEQSFKRRDIRWFEEHFNNLQVFPINYVSFPVGILSSFLFSHADNAATRLADRVDCFIADHFRFMAPSFRQAILVVRKEDKER